MAWNLFKNQKTSHDPFLDAVISITSNDFGINDRLLKNPDVFSAISLISKDVASSQVAGNTGYMVNMLNERPNSRMTGFQFKTAVTMGLLLYGNAYTEIITNGGSLYSLNLLDNGNVTIKQNQDTGALVYEVTDLNGKKRTVAPDSILHFKINALDGLVGVSPLSALRDELLIQKSANKLTKDFYNTGVHGSTVIKVKQAGLNGEAKDNIRDNFQKSVGGNLSALVVDDSMDLSTLKADTAVLTSASKSSEWVTRRVAEVFNLPIEYLGIEAVHSNAEQSGQRYMKDCLQHLLDAITTELTNKLGKEFHFDTSALTTVDPEQLQAQVIEALNAGIYTQNEAREKLGLAPIKSDAKSEKTGD